MNNQIPPCGTVVTETPPPADLMALSAAATQEKWWWSENGNIMAGEGFDSAEVAAVYTEREDDLAPANAEFIIALVNWFRSQDWTRPSLSAQAVGDGWVLVPREPTDEMIDAFMDEEVRQSRLPQNAFLLSPRADKYRAMIGAAPTPPQPADGGDRVGELVEALATLSGELHAKSDECESEHYRQTGYETDFENKGRASAYEDAAERLDTALAKFQPAGGEK